MRLSLIFLQIILVFTLLCFCGVVNAQRSILGAEMEGKCSFYADKLVGKATTSGEKYDKNIYSAAHRTLPFNTLLAVFNLETGLYIIVRVNDRGPYSHNRLIDISGVAAHDLGILKTGVAKVKIKVIGFDNFQFLDAIDPPGNEADLRNDPK
jgi:rare lipoprotein A